ncbi:MAG: hypothetical protein EBX95_13180 [Acidimicrobiia bacterium]|jgi:hypothetical protein|nr:hypothetical protein [Acidimicrobiia bacterium]
MAHKITKVTSPSTPDTFILSSYLPEDDVEEFLNIRKNQHSQFTPAMGSDSTDNFRGYTHIGSQLMPPKTVQRYIHAMNWLFLQYCKVYRWVIPDHNDTNYIQASTPFNLQHYEPGKHYSMWHPETYGPAHEKFLRAFVFMTYLNDIEVGGETEFFYQRLKVKPKRGLTLIWPAGFTHVHRGCPAPYEEKLILTGWYIYTHRLFFSPQDFHKLPPKTPPKK